MRAAAAIDGHCHVWRASDGERFPMRDKIPALARDCSWEELARIQQAAAIAGTVLVQAVDSVDESLRLLALAEREPRILGVIAWCDPTRPDFAAMLAAYRGHPKFVGVRPMPHDAFGGDWLDAAATRRAFAHLCDMDCAVDLLVLERDLGRAAGLLREFPSLRCVLNHAGRPAVMAGDIAAWRGCMQALASLPALHVKCSGLVERAGVEWTPATLAPWIRGLVEVFGDRRVIFGSNWPLLTLASRYDLWVDTVCDALASLPRSAETLDRVMRGNAAEFYRLAMAQPRHRSSRGGEGA